MGLTAAQVAERVAAGKVNRVDKQTSRPLSAIIRSNVFTLEFGTAVPGRGYIGLEEDVLVTADGIEWLSTPQRAVWLVP